MEDLQDKIIELMDLFDDEVVTTADKIDRPQRALDREAIDDFMKRNPMAGGGMLVQPSADGSRPGYADDKLNIEKFQKKNPSITRESLAAEFNPVHVWVEFINRLVSLPVGLFTLSTFLLSFQFLRKQKRVFFGSFAALALVLTNAILGAIVVSSGLKPGVITLHMALAIILICVFVYIIYRGGQRLPSVNLGTQKGLLRSTLIILFVACVVEGIMGSQVREITDELALKYKDTPRNVWHEILEQKGIYLFHRSFSWVI